MMLRTSHTARLAGALLTCLAVLAVGCGDNETSAPTNGPDATADSGESDIDLPPGSDVADDSGQTDATADSAPDVALDAGPVCPKGTGCPCSTGEQCDSGYCVDTPKGQQCAAFCGGGTCPADFKCALVSVPGSSDSVSICVPAFGRLCNPCNASAECQGPGNSGARCVDNQNSGAFCGTACTVATDCPQGYACQDVKDVTGADAKQCVVKDGGACTCTEAAVQQALATKCFIQNGEAKCQGKRTCVAPGAASLPAGGLTDCIAPAPVAETCNGKDDDCDAQTDEATCDDKNACTEDLCGGAGGCKNKNTTSPCDADSSVCTKDDVCVDGTCVVGKLQVCDDQNPCTADSCDAKTGCVFAPADGAPCNADDTGCTVADACKAGKCEAGPKKACASDDQCVEGKCSVVSGNCTYLVKESQPCNDANPCTTADACKGEQCLGVTGSCDDQSPCTADSCDPKVGCVHTPVSAPCDDKDACTANDSCTGGKCVGSAADAQKKCEDNNPCTVDSCEAALGCVHKPATGGPCDDGNKCTVNDACQNGSCVSGTNTCACSADSECAGKEDGNLCNGTLYCDKSAVPFQCKVNTLSIVKCDESQNGQCQAITCDPQTGGCKLSKKSDGATCDADGNVCTVGDGCAGGQCAPGKAQGCDDKNPCTDDVCDPKVGCKYTPNLAPCDADGNACTQADVCQAGTCVAGKPKACNDQDGCTKDECDAKTAQCVFTPLVQSCSDNNLCTSGDACGLDAGGKYTCVGGKASLCDDANPCTADTCDAQKGCTNAVDPGAKVACYSGDPKTKGKGACKVGAATCGGDGKPGICVGEVLPAQADVCDGIDNDCDGVADPGCAPTSFTAHFATGSIDAAGPKYTARARTGISVVQGEAGAASGGKYAASFGFGHWLKAFLGL